MKICKSLLVIACLCTWTQALPAQNVKLANISLGMTETEVKKALASNAPFYVHKASDYPDMNYLAAETEAESYVFTFIDDKAAGFSVVHALPRDNCRSCLQASNQPCRFCAVSSPSKPGPRPKSTKATPGGSATPPGRHSPITFNASQSRASHGCPLALWRVQIRASTLWNRPLGS